MPFGILTAAPYYLASRIDETSAKYSLMLPKNELVITEKSCIRRGFQRIIVRTKNHQLDAIHPSQVHT